MATNVLSSPESVKNCIGWMFSPLPQVGSPSGVLTTTPTALDGASKQGCKSQSYTSWDCIDRLYVGGAVVVTDTNQLSDPLPIVTDFTPDIPPKEVYDNWTHAEKTQYKRNSKVFVMGVGLLTKKQARLEIARRQVVQAAAQPLPNPLRTVEERRDPPDPNTGYYYSDILPVRSVAVTSMVSARETEPMPYSPQFQVLSGRLNDPAQTGVLSSVVRGPNVRDATTMTSLVKALSLRPSTRYEIAPLLRIGAMALSVAEESFQCDPIVHRFIRKAQLVEADHMHIYPKPGNDPAQWQMTAMPLDTFVALANNSYYPSSVPGFTYGGLDVTWTAVPIPSILMGQSHMLAYVYAFLTSDAWSGTVSYRVTTTRLGPNKVKYQLKESHLPTVNNIDIPGIRKVCLVLVDETSYNAPDSFPMSIRDVTINVPVWKGPRAVGSVSSWPLWDRFWRTDNIAGIRRDTILGFNEIAQRLGITDTVGTSLSILAELYGQWYGGLAPVLHDNTPNPDYSQPVYGAWTLDGSALDKTGVIKSHKFNLDQRDKVDARRRCVAYNFSGITPQHLCPTGLVRMRYTPGTYLSLSWSTQQPEISVPTYNIQTMTSVMRVATSLGLIITQTDQYRFASPCGFVHWVHMLSCAISFSMSTFLSINDITPKDWAGLYNLFDAAYRQTMLDTIKTNMFGGIIVHHDIENMFENITEWDLDIMSDYWLMSPYNNVDWLTFSPVPFHCSEQWLNKMAITGGTAPHGIFPFRYKNVPYTAIKITRDNKETKMNAVGSIDIYRRYPAIIVREPGENMVPVLHWFDNVAGYSNASCSQTRVLAPADMYESLTFCANINSVGIAYQDPTSWYIIGSNYEYNDPKVEVTMTTPIQWPDPPLLDTLWLGAKNYILKPAASALAGFLTGGPTGAAVAGATHIAQQLTTDLTPKSETVTPKTIAVAQKTLGLPVTEGGMTPIPQKLPTSKPGPTILGVDSTQAKITPDTAKAGGKLKESVPNPVKLGPVPEPPKTVPIPDEGPINE